MAYRGLIIRERGRDQREREIGGRDEGDGNKKGGSEGRSVVGRERERRQRTNLSFQT